jgi:hypothetical protein
VAVTVGLVLAGTAFGVWRWLSIRPPEAAWLRVSGSSGAVSGQGFQIEVRVSPGLDSSQLVVDLHGSTRTRESLGFLVGSKPVRVGPDTMPRVFTLRIPEREDLGHVIPIIFLSPTGRWRDRSHAARIDPIPVRPQRLPRIEQSNAPWAAYDDRPDPGIQPSPSRPVGILLGMVWLAAGAGAFRGGWIAGSAGGFGPRTGKLWRILAGCCVVAAAWELFDIETLLVLEGRSLALERHVYGLREPVQRWITTAVLAGFAASTTGMFLVRVEGALRLMLAGLVLFGVACTLGLLSLHAVDRIAHAAHWGVPGIQWLKLTGALIALVGALSGLSRSVALTKRTERT